MCVDVHVNLFWSYYIYIYIYIYLYLYIYTHTHTHTHTHTDLTEKVRGGMGTRREGLGGMKNWRKEKIIFVYFI